MIKSISKEDLNQMLTIEKENFEHYWSYKTLYFEVIENQRSHYFGYYKDKELLAYIGIVDLVDNIDIVNIAVKGEFKRRGLAIALFQHVFTFARKNNFDKITLEVNTNNLAAINLYKKIGFKKLKKIKNYYKKSNDDAYLMQKEVEDE